MGTGKARRLLHALRSLLKPTGPSSKYSSSRIIHDAHSLLGVAALVPKRRASRSAMTRPVDDA